MARRAAREEGILIGISSGASLVGVAQKLPELGDKPRILTFNYDSGERYLSVPDFLPAGSLILSKPFEFSPLLTVFWLSEAVNKGL